MYIYCCEKCKYIDLLVNDNEDALCARCGSKSIPLNINSADWNKMSPQKQTEIINSVVKVEEEKEPIVNHEPYDYESEIKPNPNNKSSINNSATAYQKTTSYQQEESPIEKPQVNKTKKVIHTNNGNAYSNPASKAIETPNNKGLKIALIIVSSLLVLLIVTIVVMASIFMKKYNELLSIPQNMVVDPVTEQPQTDSSQISSENTNSEPTENTVQPSNETSQEPNQSKEEERKFTHVKYGETVEAGYAQITIEKASTAQELRPSDTSSVYSYIEDQSGETFFYLTGTMKNIGTEAFDAENMTIQFVFDDKYEYYGEVLIDDGGNDFYNSTLKPFESNKYYFLASIPDELINSYNKCVIRFAYKNDFKTNGRYTDFDDCDNFFDITIKK